MERELLKVSVKNPKSKRCKYAKQDFQNKKVQKCKKLMKHRFQTSR